MKSSKSIVFALLASLLIYVVSPLGGFRFGMAYAESEGIVSTIAGIEVGNLSEDEIKRTLKAVSYTHLTLPTKSLV